MVGTLKASSTAHPEQDQGSWDKSYHARWEKKQLGATVSSLPPVSPHRRCFPRGVLVPADGTGELAAWLWGQPRGCPGTPRGGPRVPQTPHLCAPSAAASAEEPAPHGGRGDADGPCNTQDRHSHPSAPQQVPNMVPAALALNVPLSPPHVPSSPPAPCHALPCCSPHPAQKL